MHVYLPIAGMSVNALLVLGLGASVGVLSGLFGVGGGFLATPLLMAIGIPPAVAVATQASQTLGASVSGAIAHWRRGNVDLKMGVVLLGGGLVGSTFGVWLFDALRALGWIDFAIKICYVLFLGVVGLLMLIESVRAILRRLRRRRSAAAPARRGHGWIHTLPLKVRFRRSRLYVSVLPPFAIGVGVGILSSIMGVGGGFIMVPALIYLLGMPTTVVVGTSLFQIIFVTANITLLQSVTTRTVDMVLSLLLLAGSVIGARLGARMASRIEADSLRGLLAFLVLSVGVVTALDLVLPPADVYGLAD